MKARTQQKHLKHALLQVKRATGDRRSLPALGQVVVHANRRGVTLDASDLEVFLHATVPADDVDSGGNPILVEARELYDVVRTLDKGEVVLSTDDGGAHIRQGDVSLNISARGPVEDFPNRPETPPKYQDVSALLPRLWLLTDSAHTDETREVLTGIKWDGDTLAATDSFRLTTVTIPGFDGFDTSPLTPADAVDNVRKAKPDRLYAAATNHWGVHLRATSGDGPEYLWSIRNIEGTFPNYRKLIPDTWQHEATLPSDRWDAAAERAEKFNAKAKNAPVSVRNTPDGARLLAGAQEFGDISEDVPADGHLLDRQAFNPQLLRAPFRRGDSETWTLFQQDGLKPAMFVSEDGHAVYLLMPMRVS